MKIDGYPFPTNMVELKENDVDEGVKILTSGWAKRSGAVDPKAQASANQLGGQGRYDQGGNYRKPRRRVTSQMLINKYQGWREKIEHQLQERAEREANHWRCPFFVHSWNGGLRLPSIDDCPECSGSRGN